jgi:hypothetical protein
VREDCSGSVQQLITAILSTEPVSGYTHTFYRYPARFSPLFAREVIKRFSLPGDVVLDPFMGGGTTLVEAKALGRQGVGSDVSGLAVFLAKTKTTLLSDADRNAVVRWANSTVREALNLRKPVFRDEEWIEGGYQRNIGHRSTWAIRKIVELALSELHELKNDRQRMFARSVILRTAQWALDCRKAVPSASEFRAQFLIFLSEMVFGSKEFARACEERSGRAASETLCLHQSALTLDSAYRQIGLQAPSLVLTSPPYPGVHVVYHRWQVFGRRETPAAFWIAGMKDGAGASFYTLGDRHQRGLSNYFDTALEAFRAIARISNTKTTVAQMVAFSEPQWQLTRYLDVMNEAGFEEISVDGSTGIPLRTWRSVPNRKWYATKHGKSASSSEVVLFHRLTRQPYSQ